MPRVLIVRRDGPYPLFPVRISLTPEMGGQVQDLSLTEGEMVELWKTLGFMCGDSGLLSVWRKGPKGEL